MTMMETQTLPNVGIGLYTIGHVAKFLGVHPSTARGWIKAYTLVRRREHAAPETTAPHTLDDRTIVFLELVELMVVRVLRAQKASFATILTTARRAADSFAAPFPFATRRFLTEGEGFLALPYVEAGHVFSDLRAIAETIEYDDTPESVAVRYWPLGRSGRVVLDPHRRFGAPIDSETGVPTFALFSTAVAEGEGSSAAVAAWYEVPQAAVEAAVEFETCVAPHHPRPAHDPLLRQLPISEPRPCGGQ